MSLSDISPASTKTSVFRIAHISDTHISPEFNRRNIVKLKSLLSYVIDEQFDHIVITGDITAHGEAQSYRSVRRLLKYFNLLDYNKLSVTIGNHDIFGGVHKAEDLFTFGRHCRTTDYAEKVRMFERAFKETFPKKAYERQCLFPYIKIAGPVALIAMNSIRKFHSFLNPVGSNGQVPVNHLEEIERMLRHPSIADLKKIILIHHHFNRYRPYSESLGTSLYHKFESRTLKLHGKKDVENVFRKGSVDVVLHGHTHVEGVYTRNGIMYSSTALNPVRDNSDNEEPNHDGQLRFNEISVLENREIEITKRRTIADHKGSSSRTLDRKLHGE